MDSNLAVETISKREVPINDCFSLLLSIKELLARSWEVHVSHVHRQGNQCADLLASIGMNMPLGIWIFYSPPVDVADVLNQDIAGACFPRCAIV